jgi:AcrR family transcriptional regulator
VALELFERQGFEQTTVAQIAEAAGVTPMTFFRHFTTKAQALLDDPYDPVIASAVAAQPRQWRPLARAVAGLRAAWQALPEPTSDVQRRRVRMVAATPSLWGEMHANNRTTERLIADQLVADGVDRLSAHAAAAAVLAAVTTALLEWSRSDDGDIGAAITQALAVLDGTDG